MKSTAKELLYFLRLLMVTSDDSMVKVKESLYRAGQALRVPEG